MVSSNLEAKSLGKSTYVTDAMCEQNPRMLFKCEQIRFGPPFFQLESRLILDLCVLNPFWLRKAQKRLKKALFRQENTLYNNRRVVNIQLASPWQRKCDSAGYAENENRTKFQF